MNDTVYNTLADFPKEEADYSAIILAMSKEEVESWVRPCQEFLASLPADYYTNEDYMHQLRVGTFMMRTARTLRETRKTSRTAKPKAKAVSLDDL